MGVNAEDSAVNCSQKAIYCYIIINIVCAKVLNTLQRLFLVLLEKAKKYFALYVRGRCNVNNSQMDAWVVNLVFSNSSLSGIKLIRPQGKIKCSQ